MSCLDFLDSLEVTAVQPATPPGAINMNASSSSSQAESKTVAATLASMGINATGVPLDVLNRVCGSHFPSRQITCKGCNTCSLSDDRIFNFISMGIRLACLWGYYAKIKGFDEPWHISCVSFLNAIDTAGERGEGEGGLEVIANQKGRPRNAHSNT